jgi:hypothetical protein
MKRMWWTAAALILLCGALVAMPKNHAKAQDQAVAGGRSLFRIVALSDGNSLRQGGTRGDQRIAAAIPNCSQNFCDCTVVSGSCQATSPRGPMCWKTGPGEEACTTYCQSIPIGGCQELQRQWWGRIC